MPKTFYSVVIPVYRSEKMIQKTVLGVHKFLTGYGKRFEIILVNDGSPDASWSIIKGMARKYPEIIAIDLLKNYGQHYANLCGFREAKGDFIITMDDDLQNPPEEIAKLIEISKKDYDLVIGKFQSKQHSIIRRIGSHIIGWLNRRVFNVNDGLILSNFRIIRRDVINRVCEDSSFSPYIPGLVLKHSVKRKNVLVTHLPRASGKSNYTFRKILHLVANILFNHSTIPLRYSAAFGFLSAGSGFFLSVYFLVSALIKGSNSPGWASIVTLISFFSGVLILLLSVIGEYIIRVLREIDTNKGYRIREILRK